MSDQQAVIDDQLVIQVYMYLHPNKTQIRASYYPPSTKLEGDIGTVSVRPSVNPSVLPSEFKVLSYPQFFTNPCQILTPCVYHWKILWCVVLWKFGKKCCHGNNFSFKILAHYCFSCLECFASSAARQVSIGSPHAWLAFKWSFPQGDRSYTTAFEVYVVYTINKCCFQVMFH